MTFRTGQGLKSDGKRGEMGMFGFCGACGPDWAGKRARVSGTRRKTIGRGV